MNKITAYYRGMEIIYTPSEESREHNKIELNWNIEAYKEGKLKGFWNFVFMRVDSNNPNPSERVYISSFDNLIQSGRDLVDRIGDQ